MMSSGRNPFEVFTLGLCVAAGAPSVVLQTLPGSITTTLPAWWATSWALALFVGAALALTGIAWKQRLTGLIFEQVGLVIVAGCVLVYVYAAIDSVGWDAALPVSFVAAFGASCLWRWLQIQRYIGSQQRASVKRHEGDA